MAHARKQIRDAVKSAVTNLTTTGDRVYTGRTRPLGDGYQPTLLVYTLPEESGRDVHGNPPILKRPLSVFIEGRVSLSEPPDDLLDTIAAEVEAAMWGTTALDALIRNIQFVGTQASIDASGQRQLGGVRLEYRLTYRTEEGAPQVAV